MEVIIIIIIVAVVLGFVKDLFTSNSNTQTPSSTREQDSARTTSRQPKQPETPKNTFRPSQTNSTKPKITFQSSEENIGKTNSSTPNSLDGLMDAFTGEPLKSSLGLHFCQNCKVYYHTESYEVIREENSGQCVACSSRDIVTLAQKDKAKPKGRNYSPDIVTLQNYKEHVGRVITFEGKVVKVITSRRGTDYAVMFENKTWRFGFKLVFFRKAVEKVGGGNYVTSLGGRSLRARGLLINDETFGYQIIVTEKSMLLEVY